MSGRMFELGDILSVTTGRLVSPRHIDGVYDILGYMTGESLFTHQLPRASDQCRPFLLQQHPDLEQITVPDFDGSKDAVFAWLDDMKRTYGGERNVRQLDQPEPQDPIEELADMVGAERIFVFPENPVPPS